LVGQNNIIATAKQIGKNSTAIIGKNIANFLDLKDSHLYTGQCWRGTATTFLADEGFTATQMQAVTRHSSEKALNVYVDKSVIAKRNAANALSLNTVNNQSNDNNSKKTKKESICISITMNNSSCNKMNVYNTNKESDESD
jgi:hypothetical protein